MKTNNRDLLHKLGELTNEYGKTLGEQMYNYTLKAMDLAREDERSKFKSGEMPSIEAHDEDNGTIIEFLKGEKSFDGVWYGESNPKYPNAHFWWRKFLPPYKAESDAVAIDSVIDFIMNCEIPIPVEKFFNEDGSHITKKQYGIILIETLCEELRGQFKLTNK